jgi:hypothetical protein
MITPGCRYDKKPYRCYQAGSAAGMPTGSTSDASRPPGNTIQLTSIPTNRTSERITMIALLMFYY